MEVMPREKSFDPPRVRREAFSYYPRLQRLERYVESHYAEPLPLRTAAQVAGLEQTYFSRFFREKTGVCYRDWLRWVRVNRAIELLSRRDMSLTEAAFSVGFEHLGTFERACKKCTGLTPRAMRRSEAMVFSYAVIASLTLRFSGSPSSWELSTNISSSTVRPAANFSA